MDARAARVCREGRARRWRHLHLRLRAGGAQIPWDPPPSPSAPLSHSRDPHACDARRRPLSSPAVRSASTPPTGATSTCTPRRTPSLSIAASSGVPTDLPHELMARGPFHIGRWTRPSELMPHGRGCAALTGCRAFRFAPYPPLPPKLEGALAAAALRADVNMWDQVNGGPEMNQRHTHSRLSVDHLYHVAGGRLRLAEGAAVAALVCRPGGRAQDVRDRRVIDQKESARSLSCIGQDRRASAGLPRPTVPCAQAVA